MNLTLLRKYLKKSRFILLASAVFLAGFQYMFVALSPSIGEEFTVYLDALPSAIRALLGGQLTQMLALDGFLAIGYSHPLVLITLSAFAIALAVRALAGEIERRTIRLLLARPIPRYKMLTSSAAAVIAGLIVLMIAMWVGTALGTVTVNTETTPDLSGFALVAINGFFLFLAIGGYAFLFSAVSVRVGQAIPLAAGLTVFLFLLNFLAQLWKPAQFLKNISIFHYYQPQEILNRGGLAIVDLGVLLGVAVVTFALAWFAFQRRDISV
ncbi:MAG: ABC transporter permease subunit [Candidatus Bipolaricaulia bacterium]